MEDNIKVLTLDSIATLKQLIGGGGGVNLLTAYTATSSLQPTDAYAASYINGRLDAMTVRIGTAATATTGFGSICIGSSASASNSLAPTMAIGILAQATGQYAVAIGSSQVGALTTASTNYGVALGSQSVTTRVQEVSVGSRNLTRYLANVTAGTKDTDAVNVAQLNAAVGDINTALQTLISGTGAN